MDVAFGQTDASTLKRDKIIKRAREKFLVTTVARTSATRQTYATSALAVAKVSSTLPRTVFSSLGEAAEA